MEKKMDFGKSLNKRRKELSLSMDALAEKANVSKSMISKVEAGLVQPTLDIATKLAHALGFQLSEMLQEESVDDKYIHIPRGKQAVWMIPEAQASRRMLTPNLRNAPLEWIEVEIPPHKSLGILPPIHKGEKYVYLLEGRLQLTIGDDVSFDLNAGDTLFFKADQHHEFLNPGEVRCRYLLIILFR